jgi:hypothetical protein
MCATRRLKSNGGERPSSPGRSDWVEAEGSLIREMPGRVGAALTTPGRVGTARRCGSGQRDEKAYARNQCLTPLNGPPAQIWRIWLAAMRTRRRVAVPGNFWPRCDNRSGGHGEDPQFNRGDAAGVELDASLVDRLRDERGNRPVSPSLPCSQRGGRAGTSSADGTGRGGGSVVVRGRESRSHGEGSQQVSSRSAGIPGERW